MNIETIIKIKSDPLLQRYIREHSYWYKILNRNPKKINIMINEMKKAYRMTFEDKIDDVNTKVNMIKAFIDMVK